MRACFSLAVCIVIWHGTGLDKIAASVPAVWQAVDTVLREVSR